MHIKGNRIHPEANTVTKNAVWVTVFRCARWGGTSVFVNDK